MQLDIYSKIAAERKINNRNHFSYITIILCHSFQNFIVRILVRKYHPQFWREDQKQKEKKKSETLIKFYYANTRDTRIEKKKKKKKRQPAHRRSRIKHLRAADHSDRCWLCFRGLHPLDNRDYPPWCAAASRRSRFIVVNACKLRSQSWDEYQF